MRGSNCGLNSSSWSVFSRRRSSQSDFHSLEQKEEHLDWSFGQNHLLSSLFHWFKSHCCLSLSLAFFSSVLPWSQFTFTWILSCRLSVSWSRNDYFSIYYLVRKRANFPKSLSNKNVKISLDCSFYPLCLLFSVYSPFVCVSSTWEVNDEDEEENAFEGRHHVVTKRRKFTERTRRHGMELGWWSQHN